MISSKLQALFGLVAGAIVLMAVVWGFVILGSPFTERLRKFDDRRVEDLRAIRDAIERMTIKHEDGEPTLIRPLPATIEQLAAFVETEEYHEQVQLLDPQTGEKYEYTVKGEAEFELCAKFSLVRDQREDMFWNHPAGRCCFQFDLLESSTTRRGFPALQP